MSTAQSSQPASVANPAGGGVFLFPVSFAQQRLWFLSRLLPDSAAYNLAGAFVLRGKLRQEALARSLGELIRRHEILRTTFAVRDGQPVQVVALNAVASLPVIDLCGLSPARRSDEVHRLLEAEARRPFDLARGPLFRYALLHLGAEEAVFLYGLHHIVTDGWSETVLTREITALYRAYSAGRPSPLGELPIQYGDYAQWQRDWLQGEVLEKLLAYWRQRLAGATDFLELPVDHPRPAVPSSRGAVEMITLPDEAAAALGRLGRRHGCTSFHLLLAAFGVLLYRCSGQDDILIGSPVANRDQIELEDLIGLFVDTVVLRLELSGDPTFEDLLPRVRETVQEAHEHKGLPFERLITELRIEREAGRNPLFQVVFNLEVQEGEPAPPGELEMTVLKPEAATSKFDLTLAMTERQRRLAGCFEYCTDLFEAATAQRLASSFSALLTGIAEEPARRISELPLMTPKELREVIGSAAPPATPNHRPVLSEVFAAQVRRAPDAEAVVCGNERLTYGELDERSDRLAHRLRLLLGGDGGRVGIYLERSAGLVVAVVAAIKAGAAYVPLDPAYPRERLEYLLQDCGAQVLVTEPSLTAGLPEHGGEILILGEERGVATAGAAAPGTTPEHPAYIIYTSGSTGRPKGVLVSHWNVLRLFEATRDGFRFGAEDVWTLFHSYAFDFSVWEIWGALLHGGRLVVVPFWVSRSPEAFHDLLRREGVTVLNQTPSAFYQLARVEQGRGEEERLSSLRYVIFGGEGLEPRKLAPWFARYGDRSPVLVNMYGITETTVHVTFRPLSEKDLAAAGSPIGVPIPDLRVHLLDPVGQPVPPGLQGEIHVGGEGVSQGYHGRPALTAERFLPDPWSGAAGARLYRSGDLARRRLGGELVYLGRADRQVKIRGFRIEPGEIEANLSAHPGIAAAAVVVRETADGPPQLIAYVVPAGDEPMPSIDELRSFLAERLPAYMIPARFLALPALPLTPHGKLDRRALPEVTGERPEMEEAWVPPRTPVEEILAAVWAQVLGADRVGIHDNFFALGGDSIRSLQVLTAARDRGVRLTLLQLFQHQTIAALSQELSLTQESSIPDLRCEPFSLISDEDRARLPGDVEDAYPLAALQEGMLYHMALQPDDAPYHNVDSWLLAAELEPDLFRRAVQEVVRRHPLMRTSFDLDSYSQPLQLVHRDVVLPVEEEDLRHLPAADQEKHLAAFLAGQKRRLFDFTVAPQLRFHLHLLTADTFRFTLIENHAVFDGWSLHATLTEIFSRYFGLLKGTPLPQEPPPALTYRDFVYLERATVESEAARQHWRRQLDGSSATELPKWQPDPSMPGPRHHEVEIPVSAEVSAGLRHLARIQAVPIKSVLLAAHLRVLGLLSGQRDVTTGVIFNGRPEQPGSEEVRGLFLNSLPLRLRLPGGSWTDLVGEAFAAELAALPFRRFPLGVLQREAGGRALFEVLFNFINFHVVESLLESGDLEVREFQGLEGTSYPLHVTLTPRVRLTLEYDSTVLPRAEVEWIGGYFSRVFEAMSTDPAGPYDSPLLLNPVERHQLLVERPARAPQTTLDRPLHEIFAERAAREPEAVALRCEGAGLSYGELNRRANRLARFLRRRGVRPEVRVAFCLESPLQLALATMATLKAGGGCVPIDPTSPLERKSFLVADSQAALLITEDRQRSELAFVGVPLVTLEPEPHEMQRESAEDFAAGIAAENLAYAFYLSEPAGGLRGLLVTHASMLPLLAATAPLSGLPAYELSIGRLWVALLGRGEAMPDLAPYVLDPCGSPVPARVAGELFVAGDGLARGFLGRPDWTAESFLPNPFARSVREAGSRMYRSRVLARYRADGSLEVLGRPGGEVPAGEPFRPDAAISARDEARLPEGFEDACPLSLLQAEMLSSMALSPEDPPYLEVDSFRLQMRFSEALLREAARRVVARHPLLRTSFDLGASEPIQRVHRTALVPLAVEDLQGLPASQQEQAVSERFAIERRLFDVAQAPQLRFHVFVLGPGEIRLIVTHCRAILDGWSLYATLDELLTLYCALLRGEDPPTVKPPAPAYREFVALERQTLGSPAAEAFWREVLDGAPPTSLSPWPAWPLSQEKPRKRTVHLTLSPTKVDGLQTLARQARAPLQSVLLAAHLKTLAAAAGESEVVTGVAASGRLEVAGGDEVRGPFRNILPLRLALQRGSWLDLIQATQRAELAMLPHRRYPLAALQRRRPDQPLAEVTFDFVHFHLARSLARAGEVAVTGHQRAGGDSRKLTVRFRRPMTGDGLDCELEYDSWVLPRRQVEAFGERLALVLTAMAEAPAAEHEELPLLTALERQQLLVEWNDTTAAVLAGRLSPTAGRVHELFEWQAAQRPDALAVAGHGRALRYGELAARSNRLARWLRRSGVGPEVRVGLCVERTPEMVVALLAILKAGGAYVPLDPVHPVARLALVLEDSAPAVLVTEERWLERLGAAAGAAAARVAPRVICLDRAAQDVAAEDASPLGVDAPPESLAYVIYTSGSSGRPKGVGLSHGAVVAFLRAMAVRPGLGPEDVVPALTTLTFDIAGLEIYLPLAVGGRVEVVDAEESVDGHRLAQRLAASRVTVMQATPATWRLLVDSGWQDQPGLKGLCGGEALPRELAAALLARGVELWNVYGPTETAVWSTTGLVAAPGATISLGRPIANTRLYVVDHRLEPSAAGLPGELLIGGAGLARGYWRRPELTAERFVPNPWAATPGERLYRTGDLVRWRWDGEIEFLGRIDHQVKIRGFRIEPGEIEALLAQHPAVREAVVMVRQETGDSVLVAYVVPPPGQDAAPDELRRFLMASLPPYMVPAVFVALEALPRTANGKLDRRALPLPGKSLRKREITPPRSPLQLQLVQLWEEILSQRPIGIRDDFFELGGNSLVGVRLVAQIRRQLGHNLPLSFLATARTVEELAALLEQEAAGSRRHLVPIQPRGNKPPLYLMHPGHGTVLCYLDLARHLGTDQPTYGLQALDWDDRVNPFADIEEMAQRYVAEIRDHQPEGPYLIGGWSLGGVIAYEVAQQLSRAAEEIAGLFLLDCMLPVIASSLLAISPTLMRSYLLIDHVRDAAALAGKEPPPLTPYDIDGMTMDEQLDLLVGELEKRDALPLGVDKDMLRRYFAIRLARIDAQNRYVPKPYPGRITLIRTTDLNLGITLQEMRKMYRDAMANHPTYGWSDFTSEPVEVRHMPGHHESMVREPHVQALANELRSCIAEIEARLRQRAATAQEQRERESPLYGGGSSPQRKLHRSGGL